MCECRLFNPVAVWTTKIDSFISGDISSINKLHFLGKTNEILNQKLLWKNIKKKSKCLNHFCLKDIRISLSRQCFSFLLSFPLYFCHSLDTDNDDILCRCSQLVCVTIITCFNDYSHHSAHRFYFSLRGRQNILNVFVWFW